MTLNTTTFVQRSQNIHGDKYSYEKSVFVNSSTKITISCHIHGDFLMLPYNHYGKKCGCPLCSYNKLSIDRLYTNSEIIANFTNTHNNLYDYSNVIYTGSKINVEIICHIHGSFWQNPISHATGYGCPKCGYKSLRKSNNQFIEECKKIRPEYDYSNTHYINNYTDCNITCNMHGVFAISPVNILFYKQGCPNCITSKNISYSEKCWLDSLKVPQRQIRLTLLDNSKITVDGFDPETNTVYEFWGDFWHGNPDKFTGINQVNKIPFTTLYENTLAKRVKILENGFNLIEIWESDFNKKSSLL